jgi:hypothetical protein
MSDMKAETATLLNRILDHDETEDCPVCRAQDVVMMALLPAAAAWEHRAELPQHAVALHGAAGLLGTMLEAGIEREEIEEALSRLLDEIEEGIRHERILGGPAQGTA